MPLTVIRIYRFKINGGEGRKKNDENKRGLWGKQIVTSGDYDQHTGYPPSTNYR